MRVICLALLLCVFEVCYSQKADSVAEVYARHSLKDLDVLAKKLTGPFKTDTDKFRAIYKWVCDNIEYDYEFAKKLQTKRANLSATEFKKWNEEITPVVLRNLINTRSTVCSGYAWLVRELAHKAGLACEVVDGYSRSAKSNIGGAGKANHSWNAVLIDNEWRLCDPLWSAGYMSSPETFTTRFEDSYFLADPAVFILNHYPLKIEWSLLDNPPTLTQFLNGPLIYAEALRYNAVPILPLSFKISAKANNSVSFSLQTKLNTDDVVTFVVNGTKESIRNLSAANHFYIADHTFKKKGIYAVHFTVNDKYVASYEVTVH